MGMGQIFRFQALCALTLKMEGEIVAKLSVLFKKNVIIHPISARG